MSGIFIKYDQYDKTPKPLDIEYNKSLNGIHYLMDIYQIRMYKLVMLLGKKKH